MAQLGRYGAIGSTFLPTFMYYWYKFLDSRIVSTKPQMIVAKVLIDQGFTGKSFSEALILASINPQYDKRLFIDLPVLYMKTTSSEHVVYINCFECQN